MPGEQCFYYSYLLRLWQVGGEQVPVWRASLEEVQTRERYSFATVEQLFAFLEMEMRANPQESDSSTADS